MSSAVAAAHSPAAYTGRAALSDHDGHVRPPQRRQDRLAPERIRSGRRPILQDDVRGGPQPIFQGGDEIAIVSSER
jgi:hypothetical protein